MNISIGERSRTEWVDIAKGIGIVCVCLGHLGIESIDRVVFTFHMPLFFILSGMFLNGDVSFSEFIKKKSKRLLVPYYITGGIICFLVFWADVFRKMWERILPDLCSMFIAVLCGSCFKVFDVIDGVGALWFLWALFWASVLVKLLIPYKWGAVYICILSVFSYISTRYFWLPLSIQPGICASIFVYLGVRLQRVNWNEALNWKRAFGAFVVFLLEVIFNIHLDMGQNIYDYGIVSVLGAICCCYFIFYISNLLSYTNLKKYCIIMGQYSLPILCIHQIEMKVFPWGVVLHILEKVGFDRWFNLIVIGVRIVGFYICIKLWIKLSSIIKKSSKGLG